MGFFKVNWSKLDVSKSLKKLENTTDSTVRANAAINSKYIQVRLRAIDYITEPEILLQLAEHYIKSGNPVELQLFCLIKIPENARAQTLLTDILSSMKNEGYTDPYADDIKRLDEIIKKAISFLTQDNLGQVALRTSNNTTRSKAIDLVKNQSILANYARKYHNEVSFEMIKKINDKDTLEYLAKKEDFDFQKRQKACEKIGHVPDGKNKCRCSICGFSENVNWNPGLGLHDFKNNACTRCGAVYTTVNRSAEVRYDEDTVRARTEEKTWNETIIRYSDGEEKRVL